MEAQTLVTSAPSKYFVSFNGAVQTGDQSYSDESTFPIYGENAIAGRTYDVDNGGGFDIGGGAYVWKNVGVGVAFSRFGGERATTQVSIPHPLVFNRPRTAEVETHHSERAVHLQALWTLPVHESFDLTVAGGPSFYSVRHDRVTGVSISEGTEPFDTVTINGVSTEKVTEGAVGFNLGVDGVYMVTEQMGAGVMLRYSSASATFRGPAGEFDVDAGGLQFGFGLRVRF